jgi:hypothetical protein
MQLPENKRLRVFMKAFKKSLMLAIFLLNESCVLRVSVVQYFRRRIHIGGRYQHGSICDCFAHVGKDG